MLPGHHYLAFPLITPSGRHFIKLRKCSKHFQQMFKMLNFNFMLTRRRVMVYFFCNKITPFSLHPVWVERMCDDWEGDTLAVVQLIVHQSKAGCHGSFNSLYGRQMKTAGTPLKSSDASHLHVWWIRNRIVLIFFCCRMRDLPMPSSLNTKLGPFFFFSWAFWMHTREYAHRCG